MSETKQGASPKEPQLISQLRLYCQTKDNKRLELPCTDLLVTVHVGRAVWLSHRLLCCLIVFQLRGRHRLQHHNHNLSWFGLKETRSFSGGFEVQEEKQPHERIFRPRQDQLLLYKMTRMKQPKGCTGIPVPTNQLHSHLT